MTTVTCIGARRVALTCTLSQSALRDLCHNNVSVWCAQSGLVAILGSIKLSASAFASPVRKKPRLSHPHDDEAPFPVFGTLVSPNLGGTPAPSQRAPKNSQQTEEGRRSRMKAIADALHAYSASQPSAGSGKENIMSARYLPTICASETCSYYLAGQMHPQRPSPCQDPHRARLLVGPERLLPHANHPHPSNFLRAALRRCLLVMDLQDMRILETLR
jgi:hypothetical protein